MAKDKLTNNIKAAKQWLSQAESSYEAQKEVRGELNVILAQAELQRAQEKHGRVLMVSENCLVRCASMLLVIGGFIWFAYSQNSYNAVGSVQPAVNAEAAKDIKTEEKQDIAADAVPQEQTTSETAKQYQTVETPVRAKEEHLKVQNADADVKQPAGRTVQDEIGQAQLQQLIHQAGNSLKGQK